MALEPNKSPENATGGQAGSNSDGSLASNPLWNPPKRPFGSVAFKSIQVDHFMPAIHGALERARADVARIKSNKEPATFGNTIAALENSGRELGDVSLVYSNLRLAHGDPAMQALAKEIMPLRMAFESDVNLDEELFARIQKAYEGMNKGDSNGKSPWTAEEITLAEKTFRGFKRNGALLDAAGKAKLRAIDLELSTLGPAYSENVLKATNSFELVIEREEDLAGLPQSARDSALETGKERKKPGKWVFTLQAPSLIPFMKYAAKRELRKQMWMAQSTRCVGGEHSNLELVLKITRLRHERAKLLGYESHAHFQLEERMAESASKVHSFLKRLLDKSLPAAKKELAELAAFMAQESGEKELMPWDYAYWADKLKEKRFQLNQEELRPYFPLNSVLNGAFEHAHRLYDLEFKPVQLEVYADDVQTFEVSRKGEFIGLFYADFFPRSTKSGGAWCYRFKSQSRSQAKGDVDERPHVIIVCNFSKPTAGKPSLLTLMEATTLFHEFGHALHALLSQCQFRSLSCTNVYRDFVELPSQVMENWIKEKQSLALFARHYESGAVIPDSYVDKIIASDNFHAAYMTVRQLRFGYLDLAWYSQDPSAVKDVTSFEHQALQATDLFAPVPGTNMSCSFDHIFSGGYSAGYYSYKWAEVLDADAFEYFKEQGIFSKEIAEKFRSSVLERGGSEHPMTLYKRFRGREPDPEALLRRSGLT